MLLRPSLVRRIGHVFSRFVDVRVLEQRKRGSCIYGNHGNRTGPHHAVCWRWLRQRKHRHDGDDDDILPVDTISANQEFVVDRYFCWGCLHLHGGRMGRVYLRAEHGRTARSRLGHCKPLLQQAPPGLLLVLHHRYRGRDPNPSPRVEATEGYGATWRPCRLLGPATVGGLRILQASAREKKQRKAKLLRSATVAYEGVRGGRGYGHRRFGHFHACGVLRTAVVACSWLVPPTHSNRESPGRLGGRAPAGDGRCVLQVSPLRVPVWSNWIRHRMLQAYRCGVLFDILRRDGILLL